ncbi:MAG: hypothetical protein FJX11_20295 [Alphaproteobacteria bacterium]|nr:hypothetical protein [Alphaproteobacteria bacterium]
MSQAEKDEPVHLRWFCAVGDGVSDDTEALNAFFSYMGTTGKAGYIDSGTYNFTDQLATISGANICVEGTGDSAILRYVGASTTLDLITFSGANGLRLSGFVVSSSTPMSAGCAVRLISSSNLELNLVIAQDGIFWNGLHLDACGLINLNESRIYAQNDAILATNVLELHCSHAAVLDLQRH